jgi:hypothetical protein
MPITANVVAVVAIIAGLAGVWLTNRSQRALIRDRYLRDHRTETYLQLLRAVHIRQLTADEAFTLAQGQPSSLQPPAERANETELNLGAGILGFASQGVYNLWPVFDTATVELVAVMNGLRLVHNTAPEQIPNVENLPGLGNAKSKWLKARSDLVNQVRAELDFQRPRRLRRRS